MKYWEGFPTGLLGSSYLYPRLAPELLDLLCISPKVLVAETGNLVRFYIEAMSTLTHTHTNTNTWFKLPLTPEGIPLATNYPTLHTQTQITLSITHTHKHTHQHKPMVQVTFLTDSCGQTESFSLRPITHHFIHRRKLHSH